MLSIPESIDTRLAPLAKQLRSGQLSLDAYLTHLETFFDSENERIQAFLPEVGRFDRLRREAAALEMRYPNPDNRPPLFGIPVGIKDIFHVDGFLTRAGSKLPPEVLAGPQSKVVNQLVAAGALVLGKTVTTEFAYFDPGPTRNPHNVNHTPGGSSSGSAAGVAVGLAPLALGTQTIGSINRPAAFCGVVGYKPTAGRISTRNIISFSPSLDHVGFFTQDIEGVALGAQVLCRNWHAPTAPVKQPVLGVPLGSYLDKVSREGKDHFEATLARLEAAGFVIKRVEAMASFDEILVWHNEILAREIADVHEKWFDEYKELYHPKTAALIQRGHQVPPESVKVYRQERKWLSEELRALMVQHGLSVWLSPPALGTAPAGLSSTGDPIMNLPWTYAGTPAITIPTGQGDNGLPLGLQLSADCGHDEQLVGWAAQIAEALT